jgi:phosphatidate cytidylyltransferase
MALNKAVFKTRTLTALVFVAVVVSMISCNAWSFLALFTTVHAGCWVEYMQLQRRIHQGRFHPLLIWGFVAVGYSFMLAATPQSLALGGYPLRHNLVLPFAAAGFGLLVLGILRSPAPANTRAFAAVALGLVYISTAWAAMLGLWQYGTTQQPRQPGWLYPMLLIAGIWVNDTMAYLVGSFVGRTPFSKISPKKTWEGTLGGAALAVVAVVALGRLAFQMPAPQLAAIGTIAAVAGTAGDLLESWLKRRAGVKDSGSIMPGHGGFLDRFDSLLLATPLLWLYLQWQG